MHDTVHQWADSTDLSTIEAERQLLGIKIGVLCREAGINTSTYTRWRQTLRKGTGQLPNLRTLNLIRDALLRLKGTKAAA